MHDPFNNMFQEFHNLKEQLALLLFAGISGGFFRAIMAPEKRVKLRVMQGVGGALSALFLGGIMAHITNSIVDGGSWSFLAWGFIMGSGGEVAVKWAQERLMGGHK